MLTNLVLVGTGVQWRKIDETQYVEVADVVLQTEVIVNFQDTHT